MLQQIFKKWWVILLQGILLIILAIYIFNNPAEVLAGLSLWFGLLVLATGILGIIAWLSADKTDRENMSVLWSIVTVGVGLLMLTHLFTTMKAITVIFGLWMLVTGILLSKSGWELKKEHSLGWVMVITGVFSILAAVGMVFNIGTGATGVSTLLGLQVLLAGIGLVILSFLKKSIVSRVRNKIGSLKSNLS